MHLPQQCSIGCGIQLQALFHQLMSMRLSLQCYFPQIAVNLATWNYFDLFPLMPCHAITIG